MRSVSPSGSRSPRPPTTHTAQRNRKISPSQRFTARSPSSMGKRIAEHLQKAPSPTKDFLHDAPIHVLTAHLSSKAIPFPQFAKIIKIAFPQSLAQKVYLAAANDAARLMGGSIKSDAEKVVRNLKPEHQNGIKEAFKKLPPARQQEIKSILLEMDHAVYIPASQAHHIGFLSPATNDHQQLVGWLKANKNNPNDAKTEEILTRLETKPGLVLSAIIEADAPQFIDSKIDQTFIDGREPLRLQKIKANIGKGLDQIFSDKVLRETKLLSYLNWLQNNQRGDVVKSFWSKHKP